jgi:type I phosphodiesterase/nucleotide pyrophosphatase
VAAHLGLTFDSGRSSPLREAVGATGDLPRVIAVVVWDGGGRNVLREHPDAWPRLRSLRRRGVWYARATAGSSPSVSPAIHASLSTGLPPAEHGLVDMVFRHRGRMVRVEDHPELLLAPTVADRYDRRRGNRPVAALVGHPLIVGMLGQGSALRGADRDIALIEGDSGWTPPLGAGNRFRLPPYVERRVHAPDGSVESSASSRFAAFQTNTIARLLRRERIGADAIPDLLFVNYNQINEVGHKWGMHDRHMEAAVRSSDRALAELVRLFDRTAGVGEWVLILTADHGSTPDASVTGAFRIDGDELVQDLRAAFDRDGDGTSAIAEVRVTQLWLRQGELGEEGFTPDDVARFLQGYTEADNEPGGADAPVFSAAFPSKALIETAGRSPCGKPPS